MVSFTLKPETIKRLAKFATDKSLNKSAYVDRIINENIDKEELIFKSQ